MREDTINIWGCEICKNWVVIGAREKMQGKGTGRLGAAAVRNGLILKGSIH